LVEPNMKLEWVTNKKIHCFKIETPWDHQLIRLTQIEIILLPTQ
jgi:hypothetical protein